MNATFFFGVVTGFFISNLTVIVAFVLTKEKENK